MPFMVKFRLHKQDYISAHEAGQHAYCPEALRLSALNTPANADNARRIKDGRALHDQWRKAATGTRHALWLIIALVLLALALWQMAGAPLP